MRGFRHGTIAALLLLAACSGGGADGNGTEAASAEDERARTAVTHYTDLTEMFVEFPILVAGQPSRFAAHVSWMDTFKAVNEGKLTIELIRPDGTQRVAAAVSDTPGIFRPEMTPAKAGRARLVMRLDARGKSFVHDLGPVTVYPNQEAANKAHPEEEEDAGKIAFTKEIQWKIPFATAPALMRRLEDTIPVTVDVRLAPDAEAIVAAPVTGIVRTGGSVPAAGMTVQAGQTLATISAQLGGGEDVASLDLAIARARINAEAGRREVARMSSLYKAEAVPQRRLQEAQTALRLAQAELNAATRRRSALSGGGSGVALVSPISGRILSSSLLRGAPVQAGTELMRIGDPSRIWLVAHVPEGQAQRVVQATGIDLIRPSGVSSFTNGNGVQLVQSGGFVDPQTRAMDVVFAASSGGLRPGQRLQGRLRTGFVRESLSVPASAILDEGGQTVVYVQVEGEAFERRPVQVGLRSGDFVAVAGDLKPGERVVTVGAAAVRGAAATPGAFGEGHAH